MAALNQGKPTVQPIMLAQVAEERHRINGLAEGIGGVGRLDNCGDRGSWHLSAGLISIT